MFIRATTVAAAGAAFSIAAVTAAPSAGAAGLSTAAVTAAPSAGASAQAVASASATKIVVTRHVLGTVNHALFGANETWAARMAGAWNSKINSWRPAFSTAVDAAGVTALRYPGGVVANTFHWRWAIGPQNKRRKQLSGKVGDARPLDSVFGPDEFGRMIGQHHIKGNIVVNFATGTPREAADWVSYMTATSGRWAKLRAKNGHPGPYHIPYWEVGNEIGIGGETYWLSGKPTAADRKAHCTTDICLYTFGGTTTFTGQRVGAADDYMPPASLSTGKPNQRFHVEYAPIVPGTATVKVGGTAWRQASHLSGDKRTYTLDAKAGVIHFGNGVNGKIPPAGKKITISYESGPHGGFVQYYKAMKAANPNIKVCSGTGLWSPDPYFLKHAPHYDCVVSHPYILIPTSLRRVQFYQALMYKADLTRTKITALQQQIKKYQPQAQVIVSEWGHLGTGPADTPRFKLGLCEGLFTGNELVSLADAGIPLAEKHRLNDYVFSPVPPGGLTDGTPYSAMIATDPGSVVSEPSAQVLGLFSRDTGNRRLADSVSGNPPESSPHGPMPTLVVLATRRADGSINIIVINRAVGNNVTATVAPTTRRHARKIQVLTVNGPGLTAYNSPSQPNVVDLNATTLDAGTGNFTYTFPAHSVTGFTLTPRRAAH